MIIRFNIRESIVIAEIIIIPSEVVVAGNPDEVVRKMNAKDKEFWIPGKEFSVDL